MAIIRYQLYKVTLNQLGLFKLKNYNNELDKTHGIRTDHQEDLAFPVTMVTICYN